MFLGLVVAVLFGKLLPSCLKKTHGHILSLTTTNT